MKCVDNTGLFTFYNNVMDFAETPMRGSTASIKYALKILEHAIINFLEKTHSPFSASLDK